MNLSLASLFFRGKRKVTTRAASLLCAADGGAPARVREAAPSRVPQFDAGLAVPNCGLLSPHLRRGLRREAQHLGGGGMSPTTDIPIERLYLVNV
eukprot:5521041-Pyramimonas_sp.AAC.1